MQLLEGLEFWALEGEVMLESLKDEFGQQEVSFETEALAAASRCRLERLRQALNKNSL